MVSRIGVHRQPSTPDTRQIRHIGQLRTGRDRTNGINTDIDTHHDRGEGSNPESPNPFALTGAAVAVRVAAAVALVVGPWVDQATELAGWDIERFLAIARDGGRAWRDVAVEYPPGSVIVFELLNRLSPSGAAGLVTAHRLLVIFALSADLAVAGLLHRRDRRAGLTYLLLGLPLVPMGLLRLDIVAALPAVAAVLLATRSSPVAKRLNEPARLTAVSALVAAGAMIKLWPALLIPALWAIRRERTAAGCIAAGALATVWWLLWAGAGLDPIRQVVDLRGATGWQLESVGGVLTTLADAIGLRPLAAEEGVRLELNAFRIGTLIPWLVTVGRAMAVAAMAALAWRARRSANGPHLSATAAVMLGSVAALVVTSPLLSPQFLLWLTPWAALLMTAGRRPAAPGLPAPVLLTAGATILTGLVLTFFGPPDLADPVAATMLAVRNGLLIALPISCWRWLGRTDPSSAA